MAITKEERDEILSALRGDKYIQGQGCLSKDGKHCCLGVITEVLSHKLGITKDIDDDGEISYSNKSGTDSHRLDLLRDVEEYLNWDSGVNLNVEDSNKYGRFFADRSILNRISIAVLNDGGVPFKEIADILEYQDFMKVG